MVGSRNAAEAGNGGAAAAKGGRPARVFFGALLLGLGLGACAAPTAVQQSAAAAAAAAAAPIQPAALHRPILPALTGLSAAEAVGLFGEPDFRRTEPPGELWQYRSADCVLDLFLYRDPSGVRVVHSETRERNRTQAGHCRGGDGFARHTRESRL
jgi:hypothetical protein